MANTFRKIQTVTVGSGGASSIDFTNIPQTFTDLKIVLSGRMATGGQIYCDIGAYFNGSTSGYSTAIVTYTNSGTSAATSSTGSQAKAVWFSEAAGSTATSGVFGSGEMYIPNYRSSNQKIWSNEAVNENNGTAGNLILSNGLWANTAAITSISLFGDNPAGNFAQYTTATLYGISNVPVAEGAKATGGIITADNNYIYHTFLSSDTFTPTQSITCDYLVVAGGGGAGGPETAFGGGGWYGGGGGAGGYRTTVGTSGGGGSAESALSLTATAYTVTVGAGGAGGAGGSGAGVNGTNGSNSVFSTITSTGGGGGARAVGNAAPINGLSGGSGGGGGSGYTTADSTGGAGTTNQGYAGGAGFAGSGTSGNGGGAGAVGAPYTSGRVKAAGISSSISGTSVTRGTGGAGYSVNGGNIAGPANSGDGGDTSVSTNGAGLAGGSGIVIVRYAR
jgi:hypothetical protein